MPPKHKLSKQGRTPSTARWARWVWRPPPPHLPLPQPLQQAETRRRQTRHRPQLQPPPLLLTRVRPLLPRPPRPRLQCLHLLLFPPTRALPLPQRRRPLQPALAQRRLQQLRTDAADSRKFDQRRKPRDVSATSIAFVATDASARTVASRYTHRRPFLLPAPELDRDD
jgi:hypothetical protein